MSTSSSRFQDARATHGAGILESQLIHIPKKEFAEDYWSKKALLTRNAGDYTQLFSPDAVDELISERGLRTPFLRVAKDGATLPDRAYTAPAGVGATVGDQLNDTALWKQFADGATLVLQALQRTWAPVASLSSQLSTELGHPVQANAYITPPQNQGFADHYDVHDVFVLQISGIKRWIIHEPVFPDPLREQPWSDRSEAVAQAAAAKPIIDTVLEPGDSLYLPRGWLHAAQAQGEVSIHLTLGIHNWTRYALAEQLVRDALARLREDPEARQTLPLGIEDPSEYVDDVRSRLVAALADADPAPEFHRTRNSQARPAPLGPLAQLAALSSLSEDTELFLREALVPRLSGNRLETRVGWLNLQPAEVNAVERLLNGATHRAGDLGLELSQRLLRAGIVLPAR